MKKDDLLIKLKQIVKERGLKYTKQRESIFETILESHEHLNAEEIYKRVSEEFPDQNIGIATVYRALSFLEEAGLVNSITLSKESKKFEPNYDRHHDHLICIKCNKIVEFNDERIEKRQEKIAKEKGFTLTHHVMYLYGVCSTCVEKSK